MLAVMLFFTACSDPINPAELPDAPKLQQLPKPPTTYDIAKDPTLFEKREVEMFEPTPGCRCRATVVEADPPQGSFWVWAVGVYHTFPNFDCVLSNGPAGVLWDEGDSYVFDACTESQGILEFAVSPIPGNYDSVYVHINVTCDWTNEPPAPQDPGDFKSKDFYFYSPPGVDVVDERKYFSLDEYCYLGNSNNPSF
jgi:hypothetical protein